ncbi:hypothetical protein P9112_003057 [Eukaryota sp. TZLM1-RC]
MSDVEPTQTPSPESPPPTQPEQAETSPQQETEGQNQPVEAEEEYVKIKVRSSDGKETVFRIKRSTPLRKLIDTYCRRTGLSDQSLRFLYDGDRVQPHQTADDLNLDDEALIDAVLYQLGG